MTISINHATKVITIPKSDTVLVGTNAATGYEVRSYDEYALMRELAGYLDSADGIGLPNAFTHATQVVISGVIYARAITFLSPYTITFENGEYQVKLVGGSNNNMLDVLNPNNVSVIPANSSGLQTVISGSGVTSQDKTDIISGVWGHVVEELTSEEILRVMLAALAGKRQGLGTATEQYLGRDGVTVRIELSPDVHGNGTPLLDGDL